MLNTGSNWNVGKTAARCASCGAELAPGTPCWAALCDGLPVKRPAETGTSSKKSDKGDKKKDQAEAPSPFVRVDFCEVCWGAGKRPEQVSAEALGVASADAASKLVMFSFWKTIVPLPQQKKKLLVDDSVLMDVFGRMEGRTEPQEVRFRFVLALILMRKRLLKYEATEEAGAVPAGDIPAGDKKVPETWRMLPKATEGCSAAVHVINPHLTAEQIMEVSQQLSAILAEEV
jgi:hypothetical protein